LEAFPSEQVPSRALVKPDVDIGQAVPAQQETRSEDKEKDPGGHQPGWLEGVGPVDFGVVFGWVHASAPAGAGQLTISENYHRGTKGKHQKKI
jgi:hypothetical protein